MSLPPPPPVAPTPPGYQPYQAAPRPVFASFGARVGGHVLNALVGALFALPAIIAVFAVPREVQTCTVNGEFGLCEVPTGAGWAIIAALGIAGVVTFIVMYSRKIARTGQAWGHKVAGVRIVDAATGDNISAGKAAARYIFGNWINGLACYLGYLWAAWDSNKQTWGDKAFSTYSVRA